MICGRGYHASQDGTKCVGEACHSPPQPPPSWWPWAWRLLQGGELGLSVPCWPPPADVNECETGVHRCGEGQVCHNLPGSYRCDCKPGFQRDAFGRTCIGRWGWWLGRAPSSARLPQAPASLALTACLALSGRVCPAEVPLTVLVALISCLSSVSVRASLCLPTAPQLLPALISPPPRSFGSLGPSSAWGWGRGWHPGHSALLRPPAPAARRCERVLDVTHASLPAHVREHAGLLPLYLRLRLPAGGRRQALRRYGGPPPTRAPRVPGLGCLPLPAGTPVSEPGAGWLCCLHARRWEFPRVQGWQLSFCPLVGSGPGHHCGALGSGEGAK